MGEGSPQNKTKQFKFMFVQSVFSTANRLAEKSCAPRRNSAFAQEMYLFSEYLCRLHIGNNPTKKTVVLSGHSISKFNFESRKRFAKRMSSFLDGKRSRPKMTQWVIQSKIEPDNLCDSDGLGIGD